MSNRLELLKKGARKEERQIQRLRRKQTGHGNATGSLGKRSLVPGWEEQLRAPTSRRLSTIAFTTRRGSRAGRVSPSSSQGGSRRGSLTPRPPPESKTEEDQQWEDVPLEKFEHELDLSLQPPTKPPTPPQEEQPKPKPAAVFPLPASTFHVISSSATPSPRPKSKSPESAPTILPAFKPSPQIQRAREPSTVQNTMRFRTGSSAGLQPWDREQQDSYWTSGLGNIGSSLKSFWNRNGAANGATSAAEEPTTTLKPIPAPVPAESLVQTRVEAIEKKRLQQGNEAWRNKLMNAPSDILSVPKRQPGHARTASMQSASAGYKDLDTGATNMRRSISMHLPGTTPEQREILTAPADPSPKEMVNGRRPSSPPPTIHSKTTPPGPPAAGVDQEIEEVPLVSPLPTARNFSRPTSETSPPPAQRTYSLSEEEDEVLPTQQAPIEEQPSPEPVIQTAKLSEPSRQSFGLSSTLGTSHHPQYIDPVTARQMSFARAPSVVHAPIFGALKRFKQQDARKNSIFGFPEPPQSEEMPALNEEVQEPLPTTQFESPGLRPLSLTIPSHHQSFSDDDDLSPGSMSPRALTPPHVSPLVQQPATVAQRQDSKTPSPPSRTPSLSPTPKGAIQRQPSSIYPVSEEDYSMDADSYNLPPEVSAILSGQVSDSFGTLDVDRMIAQFRQTTVNEGKSPSLAPVKMMVKSPSGNVFVDPFTYVGETQQQEFLPGPPRSYSIVSPITVQAPVQLPVTPINKRIGSLVADDSGYGGDVSPRGSMSLQGTQGASPIQQPQYRLPSVAEEDVFIPPNNRIHRLTSLVDDDEYELHRSTSNKRFGQSAPAPAAEQQQPPQTPQESLNRQPSITSEYSTYSPSATPKPRPMSDYSPAPASVVAAGYQQYLDSPATYYDKTPSQFGSASFNGGSYSNTAYNGTSSSMGNPSTAAPSIHGQHFENGFTFQTPSCTPSRTSQSSRATFAKGQRPFSYHSGASSAVFDEGYHRGYEAAKRAMLQRLVVPEGNEWMDEGGPDPLQSLYDGASTILAPVSQIRRSSSLYSTQRGMVPEAKQYLVLNPGSSYAPSAVGSLYAPESLRPYSPMYGKGSISGATPYMHAGLARASQEYIRRASRSRGRSSQRRTSTPHDQPMAAYNGQARRSGAPDEMPQQRYNPIALQNAQVATEQYQNQQTQEGEMEKGKKKGLMSRLKLKINNKRLRTQQAIVSTAKAAGANCRSV
ncbi:hypothetical protein SAICODRAFT_6423 [Saitoella complicata NRRL Y-17804]|uniref:uncharacterized protein n=1 Tax=Saitoella complicata (strain BCRC 22490 / CBS 7301 / JCM 7358 / NBRC 10748 / NRRL Y-17804) TaxID=698492 RepID=UPI0008671DB2|nr:uncharacterized protein SAICODRAFT_6423 [Saitoella complicata NRRL Y-17804]ODQ54128.1 hypothetical protein SAICODRAFT_6423 [Saitoella complicata NRRL Y-17804]